MLLYLPFCCIFLSCSQKLFGADESVVSMLQGLLCEALLRKNRRIEFFLTSGMYRGRQGGYSEPSELQREGWTMVASNQGLEDDSSLVLARDDKEDRSVVDVFDATGISEQRALCAVLNGPPSSDVGESTSTVEEAIVETRQESALQRAEALAAALKNPTYIAKMGERSVIRSSLVSSTLSICALYKRLNTLGLPLHFTLRLDSVFLSRFYLLLFQDLVEILASSPLP